MQDSLAEAEARHKQATSEADAYHEENVSCASGVAFATTQGICGAHASFVPLAGVCGQVQLRDQLVSSSAQLKRLHDALEDADAVRVKVV